MVWIYIAVIYFDNYLSAYLFLYISSMTHDNKKVKNTFNNLELGFVLLVLSAYVKRALTFCLSLSSTSTS